MVLDADAAFRRCESADLRAATLRLSWRAAQKRSWARRRADNPLVVFQARGYFAVRNDSPARKLLRAWVREMETRPLLCELSSVPDVAAFFSAGAYAPGATVGILHMSGKANKRDSGLVGQWAERVGAETKAIVTAAVNGDGRCTEAADAVQAAAKATAGFAVARGC